MEYSASEPPVSAPSALLPRRRAETMPIQVPSSAASSVAGSARISVFGSASPITSVTGRPLW